ncbi:uncharacterized protein B0I36DRAFT_345822 [Microdochium trichocladiopsis]|uniref:BHLH domain-containing protein n=1 Tax=Microdochium trichocladiopsis TaxID=1682393 RepID=A0A9P9BSC0_9PEZI|nr:uncharacterized protein B0I36DRAFT_345822 [Microdochium trichocladiopsis]KAH7037750.1 hypothetical protein B0I36DRAFT_345822 [Microdochium trichocladiopsis]
MAADAVAEHTDFTNSTPTSPSQKRKRSGADSSPESRRSKRSAPSAALSATDPASAAYVESAVEAAQAAAQAANVNADFSALQQATVEHPESADSANASSTAAAALGTMYPSIHIPPSTDETFAAHPDPEPDQHADPAFNANEIIHADGLPRSNSSAASISQPSPQNGARPSHSPYSGGLVPKPAVGSEEWHKLRKDNHKEVERRRRETINEGINELAKIVPGCEKNKGSILQRAVAYITQLRENEAQNLEKWTLEKLLTEQAIEELSSSNDKLKQECERVYRELGIWKQVAQNAGLQPPQHKEDNASN